MFYLVYVSSAVNPFSPAELVELLTKAREKNSRLGITGMLLYKDGNFLQALEGEEAAVRQLYDTISQDSRHHGEIILDEGETAERQFSHWSMGFRNLDDKEVQATPGFSQFMNKPLNATDFKANPTVCWELLNLFRDKM